MQNKYLLLLCCFTCYLILTSCARAFVIVDRTGMTFNLDNVQLKENEYLEILDGEALREIPLKLVAKLVLDPSKTFYRDDKLYYHSVIELLDGTKIKPRKSGNETTKSFVNIHNTIIGKGKTGYVQIPLEDINVISQTRPD
jgi:hypothetical protein